MQARKLTYPLTNYSLTINPMAIIVEEDKKMKSGVAVLGWLVILVIVLVAAYYLFVAGPSEIVNVTPPDNFAEITALSELGLPPMNSASSSELSMFKQYVPEPASSSPVSVGRPDPFIAP